VNGQEPGLIHDQDGVSVVRASQASVAIASIPNFCSSLATFQDWLVPMTRRAGIAILLTDVLTYRFKRVFGFHGRLLPSHGLRSVTNQEQPAIFSKWFMDIVLRHG
jgi:hypothetical protein